MTVRYPPTWSALQYPWVRAELLNYLAEICDPAETAKWLTPDPHGPIIGIDQTIHFFFDDHDFDAGDIGYSLFDGEEVAAIAKLKDALRSILDTKNSGDARYYLGHPLWHSVIDAAEKARDALRAKGVAAFE